MAKAIYCEITNVKKVPSRAVSVITIEVPIEQHKSITSHFDEETVLITLANLDQQYGIVEGKKELEAEQVSDEQSVEVDIECIAIDPEQKIGGVKEKPLSCQAHLMIKEQSFCDFIDSTTGYRFNSIGAESWIKDNLCIISKTELDDPINESAIAHFKEIQSEWRHWVNSR